MAYIQNNPFSRRTGKAKREAKRQLKSLYKQGYSNISRNTDADGSVSYSGAGQKGPEQKLDRRSRRNIRQEARGDKMTNDMNMDQRGNRTTEVKRLGMNRMSSCTPCSSPLNYYDENGEWVEELDPNFSDDERSNVPWTQVEGNPDYEYRDLNRTTDDNYVQGTPEQEADFDKRCAKFNKTNSPEAAEAGCVWGETTTGRDVRRRKQTPVTTITGGDPVLDIPTNGGSGIDDLYIPVTNGSSEEITIGGNERVVNPKVPVTTTREVERKDRNMEKVCTNWQWVDKDSGMGERRRDAGPPPTKTITKTRTRMQRI